MAHDDKLLVLNYDSVFINRRIFIKAQPPRKKNRQIVGVIVVIIIILAALGIYSHSKQKAAEQPATPTASKNVLNPLIKICYRLLKPLALLR